jgi:hypothetical protein
VKLACLLAAIFVAAPSICHATHVTVPGDYATIQAALDGSADTTYACTGEYPEDLVIRRSTVLLPAPTNTYGEISLPIVRSLFIDAGWHGSAVIRGFCVRGPARLEDSREHLAMLTLEACRLEGGLTGGLHVGGPVTLHVLYCTILGPVNVQYNAVDFTLNTVLDGTVEIFHEGYQTVQGNYIRGAAGTGVIARWVFYRPDVYLNTIVGCSIGAKLPTGGNFVRNHVVNCGDGLVGPEQQSGFIRVSKNRIEHCGRGIYIAARSNSNTVIDNVVLSSTGDGITAVGYITGNTVAGSGGTGITRPRTLSGSLDSGDYSTIERNVSTFNAGFGLQGSSHDQLICNDWFGNGSGATQGLSPGADDIQLDPLFCDLAAGDVRVNASSPLFSVPCGPIGADTVGCGVPSVLLDAPRPATSVLGVRSHGRQIELSLIDSSTVALEVIDVQGRRVSRMDIASPGTGSHQIALSERVPAGIYFLKLRQSGREVTGKAVVLN